MVKVGKPYEVLGRAYVPSDDPAYDETGLASWYGPGFHAKSTANGEVFDQEAVSAAHKTLPMPSYVEVTNLDTGRTLTLRVNDRGPFVDGRIIDLSRRSAQMLGVYGPGTARVRVRRVAPSSDQIAALKPPRWGEPVLLAAAPAAAPAVAATRVTRAADAQVASVEVAPSRLPAAERAAPPGAVLIQVAAVADEGRATWLAGFLSGIAPARIEKTATGLHRVRLGPFPSRDAATAALTRVRAAGYEEAWITGGANPVS